MLTAEIPIILLGIAVWAGFLQFYIPSLTYYWDRQAWAHSVDPDQTPQTRRLIRVYTV